MTKVIYSEERNYITLYIYKYTKDYNLIKYTDLIWRQPLSHYENYP